jgi:hypothetical protein
VVVPNVPASWVSPNTTCTFDTYNGVSNTVLNNGPGPGKFLMSGHYRIFLTVWCDCGLPRTLSLPAGYDPVSKKAYVGKPRVEELDPAARPRQAVDPNAGARRLPMRPTGEPPTASVFPPRNPDANARPTPKGSPKEPLVPTRTSEEKPTKDKTPPKRESVDPMKDKTPPKRDKTPPKKEPTDPMKDK